MRSNSDLRIEVRPPETAPAPETEPQELRFHAHWAWFVGHAFEPIIFFVLLMAFSMFGVRDNWPIMSYPHVSTILLVVFIGLIIWILYIFIDWVNDIYIVDADSVKDINKRPFMAEEISIAMMQKIQSVRFKKNGIFQIMLNYGTVYITVGEAELDFNYVPDPEYVQHLIMMRVDLYNQRMIDEQEIRQQKYISGLVDAINQRPAGRGQYDS